MLNAFLKAWHAWDVERRVRHHGWTAVYVGDYHTAPTWAYTVGLDEALDQPEIVVFDVPRKDASAIFWTIFEELEAKTLVLRDGSAWPPEHETPAVWRKVHPTQIDGWLTLAAMRRAKRTGRPDGLEAYQLVLADAEGRYPWDEGYDDRLRPRQPALYLPAEPEDDALAARAPV